MTAQTHWARGIIRYMRLCSNWFVVRTLEQFASFHKRMKAQYPQDNFPHLPGRENLPGKHGTKYTIGKLFGRTESNEWSDSLPLSERLERYMATILAIPGLPTSGLLSLFLKKDKELSALGAFCVACSFGKTVASDTGADN